MSGYSNTDALRSLAAKLRARNLRTLNGLSWLHEIFVSLEFAADTIDALTRELTEATSGDDRLEREQAATNAALEEGNRETKREHERLLRARSRLNYLHAAEIVSNAFTTTDAVGRLRSIADDHK